MRIPHLQMTEQTSEKSPDVLINPDSPDLAPFYIGQDTEEAVQVGQIYKVELPEVKSIITTPIDERKGELRSLSTGFRKRLNLSRKNPYRTSESLEIRTKMKAFLAPPSSGVSFLSFESGPPRVLLVEDNSVQREMMKTKLTLACRWEPDIARDGAEAVLKFKAYAELSYRYVAIFMDLTMPKMDGFEATKQIRKCELSQNYSRTRIIGLLGSFEADSEEKCKEVGMNSTVLKDVIEVKELAEMVEGIIAVMSLNLQVNSTVSLMESGRNSV
jgi:CheY-like chemotaxis protein